MPRLSGVKRNRNRAHQVTVGWADGHSRFLLAGFLAGFQTGRLQVAAVQPHRSSHGTSRFELTNRVASIGPKISSAKLNWPSLHIPNDQALEYALPLPNLLGPDGAVRDVAALVTAVTTACSPEPKQKLDTVARAAEEQRSKWKLWYVHSHLGSPVWCHAPSSSRL